MDYIHDPVSKNQSKYLSSSESVEGPALLSLTEIIAVAGLRAAF